MIKSRWVMLSLVAWLVAGCEVFELDEAFVYCDELYGDTVARSECTSQRMQQRYESEKREQCRSDWEQVDHLADSFVEGWNGFISRFGALEKSNEAFGEYYETQCLRENGTVASGPRCSVSELVRYKNEYLSLRRELYRLESLYKEQQRKEHDLNLSCRKYADNPDERFVFLNFTEDRFEPVAKELDHWAFIYDNAISERTGR